MILVAGCIADSVTELVCARLDHHGFAWRLLDLARYPDGCRLAWRFGPGGPEGFVSTPEWTLDLAAISGVYIRFAGPEVRVPLPGLDPATSAALQAEADLALMALVEDLSCPVVNRAGGGASNNSKPCQALLIGRAGLKVPETLVTSDPEAARAFHAAHGGEIVYKSISGIRSIVRRVGPAQLARLDRLREGPAQLQAFVPGVNVRVHTVGDRLFATRIDSDAVDYRYGAQEGHDVRMTPILLPPETEAACHRIARDLDLLLAGIDLKITPEGEVYCFEVNPCPGFIYFERHSGQPISLALAELLAGRAALPQKEAAMS